MRRIKETNLVNISFIDMLGGALGAVMILFVIIPKASFNDLERIKALDALSIEMSSMDSIIGLLKTVVPEEEYQELINSSALLQANIESLKNDVESLQSALVKKTDQYNNIANKYEQIKIENAKLTSQIKNAAYPKELNRLKEELKAAKAQIASAQKNTPKSPPPTSAEPRVKNDQAASPIVDETPGVGDAIFGIDPPLTIMINWPSKDDKVRLYMRESGTNIWCFYQTKRRKTNFGLWDNSMRKLTSMPFEAIVQKDGLVPGVYEIHAQPATLKNEVVEVSGFIAMKIPDKPIKRYNISPREMKLAKAPYTSGGSQETLLGVLTVTTDDISWSPN